MKKNISFKMMPIVSILMLFIFGCKGGTSPDNEALYGNTIAALGDNERIAFVDIGEKNVSTRHQETVLQFIPLMPGRLS